MPTALASSARDRVGIDVRAAHAEWSTVGGRGIHPAVPGEPRRPGMRYGRTSAPGVLSARPATVEAGAPAPQRRTSGGTSLLASRRITSRCGRASRLAVDRQRHKAHEHARPRPGGRRALTSPRSWPEATPTLPRAAPTGDRIRQASALDREECVTGTPALTSAASGEGWYRLDRPGPGRPRTVGRRGRPRDVTGEPSGLGRGRAPLSSRRPGRARGGSVRAYAPRA